VSEDLPKQELLIKLLKMTTSSNDGEAVIAVRKANDLLKSAGWDWEKLIHGKIKVIEDPFKSVDVPLNRQTHRPPPAPPRPAPKAPPFAYAQAPQPAQAPPPPRPPRPPHQPTINSNRSNLYAGWCYCCGDAVLAKDGFIFDPSSHNTRAKSKWQIACKSCNSNTYLMVPTTAAPRQRPLGNATPSLNDI
jgi:hypothetical protein